MISTEKLFDTIQAARNLDTSSEKKKMWFTLSLDIIVGIEAAKLSPMETLIENPPPQKKMGEERKIYTYTEEVVNLLRV